MTVWTNEMKAAAMKDAQRVCDLYEALSQIKKFVVGEKAPNWIDQNATTFTRGKIADICDAALAKCSPLKSS